jgi:hypothetical protein
MKYFEDVAVGDETVFGHYDVTREEVLEFARKYDPQPFICPTRPPPRPTSAASPRAAGTPAR